jgi:hypothetical protein
VASATPKGQLVVADTTPGVVGHSLGGEWGGRATPFLFFFFLNKLFLLFYDFVLYLFLNFK